MNYIVGIDEVGRGPLAGPVTVGIVVCEEKLYKKLKGDKNLPPLGKDSKKLSPLAREKYSKVLKNLEKVSRAGLDIRSQMSKRHFGISVMHVSNKVIDKIGISNAIKKAITRGLLKISRLNLDKNTNYKILLDGGLKAPPEFTNQKTIVRGDEKEKIIAWASILAKVSRDELMRKTHKKYPQYGFHIHKGYGTLAHRDAIKKHGLSLIHRRSFCKKLSSKHRV